MIDENKTFILFGYTSDTLSHGSGKKVWKICDVCKIERIVKYCHYTHLCHTCSHRTKECRLKHSENNSEKNHPMYDKHHTEETKQKISNSIKGNKHPQWRGGKKLRFARSNAKRRKLFGFIPHNKPQKGFHGHHIDFNHVIFIPQELHTSISHSVINNKNMNLINDAVCDWYLKFQIII